MVDETNAGDQNRSVVLRNAGEGGHVGGASPFEEAVQLLAEGEATLAQALAGVGQPPWRVLDTHLPLESSLGVELLACDELGTACLVLFCGSLGHRQPAELGRVGQVLAAFRRGAGLLDRAFVSGGLNSERPPHVLLLAERFSDEMPALLGLLAGGVSVAAQEYRLVPTPEGELILHLAPLPGLLPDGGAGRTASPPGPSPRLTDRVSGRRSVGADQEADGHQGLDLEPSAAEALDWDVLMDRARLSIVCLSEQVSEQDDGDEVVFLVDGSPLATLRHEQGTTSVMLQLDGADGPEADYSVTDELSLNHALNALFDKYFQGLDEAL